MAAAEAVTIPTDSSLDVVVDEEYLLRKATDGCTQLISSLWQLPVERSDAGMMVQLPSYEEIKIPRALVSLVVTFSTTRPRRGC